MREILFRGKRVDNGEWVYGDYHNHNSEKSISFYKAFVGTVRTMYAVIPETVGQYTGLKDKNGTRIFEGDIIQSIESGETGEIQYLPEHAAFMIFVKSSIRRSNSYLDYLANVKPSIVKVIGNIYDNPELKEECR